MSEILMDAGAVVLVLAALTFKFFTPSTGARRSVERAAPMMLNSDAQRKVDEAIHHWQRVVIREDEAWQCAFTCLSDAIGVASYLDIRLYMYSHSTAAYELFRRYESEIYD